MAMDKEKLLAYFETQYLSRREILFKLPLNISIDNFWPVLLNRRKAKATLLPLQNAAGMPYWYVLTDRMIAASERLCEEAIRNDSAFDPYRAGMTSAMTEEMFFTSFVEGAQIPLQEAMDFLQRGTEPESIQEQMIWNNRRAWAEMSATLYRPLDENFVRGLALMLTEEMDNCAADYRQTDQHAIAAMENEEYVVPPAYSLPDRMRDYYQYLQKPDEHPLIKAAVAQAYLLVTRPFPEGNERLSRMMSSAVLLRCGYDFFRDISISSVIARESYLYYKCMCEIIRSENGGDLTYFLQYYLEMLARSLDVRDERLRRLEQEALEREREKVQQEEALARQPLRQPTVDATASGPGDADSRQAVVSSEDCYPKEVSTNEVPPEETSSLQKDQSHPVPTLVPLMSPAEYLEALGNTNSTRTAGGNRIQERVRKALQAGMIHFTVNEWTQLHGETSKSASNECQYWYRRGWMSREKLHGVYVYTLRVTHSNAQPAEAEDEDTNDPCSPPVNAPEPNDELDKGMKERPPTDYDFDRAMEKMDNNRSDRIRLVAATIRDMMEKGVTTFTPDDLKERLGITLKRAQKDCLLMRKNGIIHITSVGRGPTEYGFFGRPATLVGKSEYISSARPSENMISELKEMESDHESKHVRKLATTMLRLIDKGMFTFTETDVVQTFGLVRRTCNNLLRESINLGFLQKVYERNGKDNTIYFFLQDKKAGVRGDGLTKQHRTILTALYSEFECREFTVYNAASLLNQKYHSIIFHIQSFVQRGILKVKDSKVGAYLYTFATTPEEHPECFSDELKKRRERDASTTFLSEIAYSPGA